MPRVKRYVLGRPMASGEMEDTLLSKFLALPIFASDALSSVAYATEAALVVLLAASASGRSELLPVSLAIAGLLAIVVASYRQTVVAYDTSGGAYIVAKENLGKLPSLVAAAALLTDYVLTVAVSVAAGILAITSAVPSLAGAKVWLCVGAIALITVANLRGLRESGLAFAIPTYGFILSMLVLVVSGAVRCSTGSCGTVTAPHPIPIGLGTIGVFILLRAFASGASALTGVEAIANGVSAFRKPQAKNAAATLAILGALAVFFFVGVSYLAWKLKAVPNADGNPSVLSEVARTVFAKGSVGGFLYYVVQFFTLAVLVLAANTSFQGFPRLAALLARDRFAPRQFTNLGDRLVFSNGVVVLAGIAAALIWVYGANVNSLIHLYVIGVFTAFTISQTGMVRYWLRTRDPGWRYRGLINTVGATATGLVTLIVVWTKFAEGAWLVIVAIPLLVLLFLTINRHYRRFRRRLEAGATAVHAAADPRDRVLVVVEAIDVATEGALWYARQIEHEGEIRALHVPGSHTDSGIRPRWYDFASASPQLEVLPTDEGRILPVLEEVWRLPRGESDFVTVVIPEQFRRQSLISAAGRTSFRLKLRLLAEPGVVVADVPVVSRQDHPDGHTPKRIVVRILLANMHGASMRAINYARSLGIADTRAVSFALAPEEARGFEREWTDAGAPFPLDLSDAPYRDVGDPLLAYLRELTAQEGTVVNVVMPEIVVRGWPRLLHNQRALYIKRTLLFEQHVILSSVPYQLFR